MIIKTILKGLIGGYAFTKKNLYTLKIRTEVFLDKITH